MSNKLLGTDEHAGLRTEVYGRMDEKNHTHISDIKQTPTGASEPLYCPFCGHHGVTVREGSTFRWRFAECNNCGANAGETRVQTLGEGTHAEWETQAISAAIEQWNRRTPAVAPAVEAPIESPADKWANSPEWAKWWSTDEDGECYFFSNKPERGHRAWVIMGGSCVHADKPSTDWRESLEQRP